MLIVHPSADIMSNTVPLVQYMKIANIKDNTYVFYAYDMTEVYSENDDKMKNKTPTFIALVGKR